MQLHRHVGGWRTGLPVARRKKHAPGVQIRRHARVTDDLVAEVLVQLHVGWTFGRERNAGGSDVVGRQLTDSLEQWTGESTAGVAGANANHVQVMMARRDRER